MKKKALLSITFIMLAGAASSVVGGPNASDGEFAITSTGSSASATTAVGPNGTEYEAQFSVVNRSTSTNQTGVINSSFDGDTVNFTGVVETPTPCYKVNHSIDRTGDGQYSFTVNTEEENGTCTQVIAYHKYEASFTSEQPYQLEVNHVNSSVKTFTHPDYSENDYAETPQEGNDEAGGPLTRFFKLLISILR